ncbi:hypothetical protein Tco_0025104 [Tanacetum coccineum]
MEETFHVTFSEDDEAISQTSTEGDAINFNEVNSFPDDEFREPRNWIFSWLLSSGQGFQDPPDFTTADNHPALSEPSHLELDDNLEPSEIQNNVINKPIIDIHHSPSDEDTHLSPVTQDR